MPVPLENDPPVLNVPTVGVDEYVAPYRAPRRAVLMYIIRATTADGYKIHMPV